MSGRIASLDLLEPQFSRALLAVMDALAEEAIPLQVFETIRSPWRQRELYSRGRNPAAADFGRTVTKAQDYQSAHQFGLAVDMVFHVAGKWSWTPPTGRDWWWKRYHEIAREHGLVPLSFEKPHVQVRGFDWKSLERGPEDEAGWLEWLGKRNARAA